MGLTAFQPRSLPLKIKKAIRRLYVHWSRLVTTYPIWIIGLSIIATLASTVSFLMVTPFTIGISPIQSEIIEESGPAAFVLQFTTTSTMQSIRLDALFDFVHSLETFKDMKKYCFHASGPMNGLNPKESRFLPRNDCLILSPASIYSTREEMQKDSDPSDRIKSSHKVSKQLTRLLWGGNPSRNPPTVTVVLESAPIEWVQSLVGHVTSEEANFKRVTNVYYHGGYPPSLMDWLVYLSVFVFLNSYYYIAVRKINYFKSSVMICFAATFSLVLALVTASGVCLAFGLPTFIEIERGITWISIYYMFTFIAFESILVMTKSVIDTPVEEGPTERIAHGIQSGGNKIIKYMALQVATCVLGLLSEESWSFSIFSLIMVLSNFVWLHSFFIPILFLEIRQLERTEPVFIKTRSKPSEHLHKLMSNHVTKRRRQNDETELDEVNASEDLGENFTDNVNGYKYEQVVPLRIRMMSAWAHSLIAQKISIVVFVSWLCFKLWFNWDEAEAESSGDPWRRVSWSDLFRHYDIDLRGQYLTFFPPVRVTLGSDELDESITPDDSTHWMRITPLLFVLVGITIFSCAVSLYKFCCSRSYGDNLDENLGCLSRCFSTSNNTNVKEATATTLENHPSTIHLMKADLTLPNLIATVCIEGNLRVFDVKHGRKVAELVRSRSLAPLAAKRNEHKMKAMLYHGLTYRNGQIAFQSSLRTNGFFFTSTRAENKVTPGEQQIASRCWAMLFVNKMVVLGLSNGVIELYHLTSESELVKCDELETKKSGICHLVASPQRPDEFIAVNLNSDVFVFDVRRDSIVLRSSFASGHSHAVTVARILSQQLVTGSTDETLRVISSDRGKVVHVLKGHLYPITAVGLCKNGKGQSDAKVMSADESGEIRLWTLTSGRCQFILREKFENEVETIRLTQSDPIANVWPTKNLLLAVTASGRLLVWTHRSGHFRHAVALGRSTQGGGVLFGDHFIVLAVDQSVVMLDLRVKKEKLRLEHIPIQSGDEQNAFAQTPKHIYLFDQEITVDEAQGREDPNRNLIAIVSHGNAIKKISLCSHF